MKKILIPNGIRLLLLICVLLMLHSCNSGEEVSINDSLIDEYENTIKLIRSYVTELEQSNVALIKENEEYEKEIKSLEIKLQDIHSLLERISNEKSTYGTTEEFFSALDQSDDTFEELINFYYYDIGDGGFGQAYGGRVLDYYYELDFDQFLKIARKLNDRAIDNFAYNFSEAMLWRYQNREDYCERKEEIKNVLIEKLNDLTITNEDRQLIHSLLSHWYRNGWSIDIQ